ncbi:MAG: hypothetical protein ACFFCD_18100 [Promethearchaeota archaeon]
MSDILDAILGIIWLILSPFKDGWCPIPERKKREIETETPREDHNWRKGRQEKVKFVERLFGMKKKKNDDISLMMQFLQISAKTPLLLEAFRSDVKFIVMRIGGGRNKGISN